MSNHLIAIDASPNLQKEDTRLVVNLLARPWKWNHLEYRKRVINYFKHTYQTDSIGLTGSGRAALQILLSSLITTDDEVLVQAFTCLVVPNAVVAAGGKTVFVDIDKKTYNIDPIDLEKKISKKSKVVIVQHTFGIPAPLKEIEALCKKYSLILIEDCAHALGAVYNGKPVGSFGYGSIFSFNQDKVISGVSGGAFIVRESKRLPNNVTQKSLSNRQVLKILLHPLLWSIALPSYTSGFGKAFVFAGWKLGILGNTITHQEGKGDTSKIIQLPFSEPQATLVYHQLQQLDTLLKRRREIVALYKKELSDLPVTHPEPPVGSNPIYLRYPLQVKDPHVVIRAARENNIILGRWYSTPVFPWKDIAKKYYKQNSCPIAEQICNRVINLPTYPRLSNDDVYRIINTIKKVYD